MADAKMEEYVAAIAGRLRSLPPSQREEELREIRQHLDALVAGHRARGASEKDAVDAALAQFGRPEQVGRQIHGAWARQRPPRLWPALLAYPLLVVAIFTTFTLANDRPTDFPHDLSDRLLLALAFPAALLAAQVSRHRQARTARPPR